MFNVKIVMVAKLLLEVTVNTVIILDQRGLALKNYNL